MEGARTVRYSDSAYKSGKFRQSLMDKVRVAVVGVGDWGEKHLRALKVTRDADVVAVCDAESHTLRRIAAQYRIKRTYTELKELLAKETLDAVHVVTPEPAHRRPVVEAMRHGLHVLVEKPIATSLEDADSMIAAARKHNVILMVGHVLRWDTRYAMVRDYVRSGKIGRIGTILARRSVSRSLAPIFMRRSTPVMQLGIHDIDLILWYTGSEVTNVYARSARFFDYRHPDMTTCTLDLKGGAHAVVQNAFSLPSKVPFFVGARMEIVGSKGLIIVDASEQSLFLCDKDGWQSPDTTLIPVVRNNLAGALTEEVGYFIRCVSRGQHPEIISPQESREALKVALACEDSVRRGGPVRV